VRGLGQHASNRTAPPPPPAHASDAARPLIGPRTRRHQRRLQQSLKVYNHVKTLSRSSRTAPARPRPCALSDTLSTKDAFRREPHSSESPSERAPWKAMPSDWPPPARMKHVAHGAAPDYQDGASLPCLGHAPPGGCMHCRGLNLFDQSSSSWSCSCSSRTFGINGAKHPPIPPRNHTANPATTPLALAGRMGFWDRPTRSSTVILRASVR